MTSKSYKTWIFLTVLFGLLLINGCTHTINIKVPTFTDYPQQQKHPLTIALRLNENYYGYVKTEKAYGDTFHTPLGEALEKNGIFVVEQSFDKVHIVRGSQAEIPEDAKAVLTPKVISCDFSGAISTFDEVEIVIDLEWILQDRAGNTIWLKTVRGKARSKVGTVFSSASRGEKRFQMAMKDLFNNSYQAISTSPLIRAFEQDQ